MEVLQLINEEGMIVLGYQYFTTPIDVGNEYQWLLTITERSTYRDGST